MQFYSNTGFRDKKFNIKENCRSPATFLLRKGKKEARNNSLKF